MLMNIIILDDDDIPEVEPLPVEWLDDNVEATKKTVSDPPRREGKF